MITCVLWDIESRDLDRRPRGPKVRVAFYLILRKWLQPRRDFNFYYNIGILLACLQENLLYWIISELYIESTVLDKRKQKILQWTLYIEFINLSNVDELKHYGI